MSFFSSTRSNPNVIPEVDNPKRQKRRTDVAYESSYHTAYASKEILPQETEIMDVWTQGSKDCDSKDAENGDEDIKIEDNKSDLDRKRAQKMEYQKQDFVTLLTVRI